ncbi:hypothetical protein [Flavobacterium sp.]|nr:hypothetical protein [Flavobacterium sp.]
MKKIKNEDLEKVFGGKLSPAQCALVGFFLVGWVLGPAVLGGSAVECWNG